MARKRKHQRLDVDSIFATSEFFEGLVRPSLERDIKREITRNHILTIADLCSCSEEKLSKMSFATPKVLEVVNERLQEYGLHLYMTKQEMDDYVDAEYYEEHPEEREELYEKQELVRAEFPVVATFVADEKTEEECEKKENTEESSPKTSAENVQQKMRDFERTLYVHPWNEKMEAERKAAIERDARSSNIHEMTGANKEFLRMRYVVCALYDQPWFYRWFHSMKDRLIKAFTDGYIMYESHVNMAIDRSLESERTNYIEKRKEVFKL